MAKRLSGLTQAVYTELRATAGARFTAEGAEKRYPVSAFSASSAVNAGERLGPPPPKYNRDPIFLTLCLELDLYLRRRNCDRAVQRSSTLKTLDQLRALLVAHTRELKLQPDGIE